MTNRKHSKKPDASKLIEQLARQEDDFLKRTFLAPAIPGGTVRVRIGDAICKIKIAPDDFSGFGVFEPISITEAILVREASLAERKKYLELFPKVRLILCRRRRRLWMGCAANQGDRRFKIDGVVPIQLSENVERFDIVACRFDGSLFWFEEIDSRANPGHARYLREAFADRVSPADLSLAGLTAEQRAAYEYSLWLQLHGGQRASEVQLAVENDDSDPVIRRLGASLSHGGARLISFAERNDYFQVTYEVDGRRHTSAVDKESLTVFSAGICLDGLDQEFDLTSLVGVMREGRQTGQLYDD